MASLPSNSRVHKYTSLAEVRRTPLLRDVKTFLHVPMQFGAPAFEMAVSMALNTHKDFKANAIFNSNNKKRPKTYIYIIGGDPDDKMLNDAFKQKLRVLLENKSRPDEWAFKIHQSSPASTSDVLDLVEEKYKFHKFDCNVKF